MLSLSGAMELDFSYGTQDLDVGFAFGFTPWGPDVAPEKDHSPALNVSDVSPPLETTDEEARRLRRKISNRESARRSRMRKQQHMEELRGTLARLREENRELAATLEATARRGLLVRRDNARLRAEAAVLRRRLQEARRVVVLRRLDRILSSAPAHGGSGYASGLALGLSSLMA